MLSEPELLRLVCPIELLLLLLLFLRSPNINLEEAGEGGAEPSPLECTADRRKIEGDR